MLKIWRNDFSKISTLIRHTSKQDPTDANDFRDMHRFLSHQTNHDYARETDDNSGCENQVNQEIKCAACGSTNLIKISDYSKAILFLGDISDNPEREKIRTSNRMAKGNKFPMMWWCLHCKRLC
jgi:hypothetical protein